MTAKAISALLPLLLILSAAPACALEREKYISNPCLLAQPLLEWRAQTFKMGKLASDAGNTALRLRSTRRSRPYKYIEKTWFEISRNIDPTLDALTDVPLQLYQAPDTRQKESAIDLASAYQTALQQILDYTHSALYYERMENSLGVQWLRSNTALHLGSVSTGVANDVSKSAADTISRNQFDGKFLEVYNALLATKLPEHRYAKYCHVAFPPITLLSP